MADRFPALEDFESEAQTDIKDTAAETSADNFLAREQAILGDDARQFTDGNDAAALADPDLDILGNGGAGDSALESRFPDVVGSSTGLGGLPGTSSITGPSVSYNSGYKVTAEEEEEPEVIKQWRERRDAQIAKRAEQFAAQREDTIKEAQGTIDDFYENYNSKKEKGIAQTRKEAEQFLANRDDKVGEGTTWDRIAKLVDVSGKGSQGGAAGSGKERFREMLTSLRKDEKAPVATGYVKAN